MDQVVDGSDNGLSAAQLPSQCLSSYALWCYLLVNNVMFVTKDRAEDLELWTLCWFVMGTSLNHYRYLATSVVCLLQEFFDLIDAIVYIRYQLVLSNGWQKSIDHLPKSYSGARTAGTDPCYDFVSVDGEVLAGHPGPWTYHMYWCNESMGFVAECYVDVTSTGLWYRFHWVDFTLTAW